MRGTVGTAVTSPVGPRAGIGHPTELPGLEVAGGGTATVLRGDRPYTARLLMWWNYGGRSKRLISGCSGSLT